MVKSLTTVLLMVAASSTLGGGRFNADALRQRLQDAAAPPADAAGQTQSALDEHARQLQGIADKAQGIDQLPQATEDLAAVQADLEKSLSGVLDPANLDKLEGLHEQLGNELRTQIMDGVAGDVLKDLKPTADQVKALKPMITEQLTDLGQLFDSAWKTGGLEAMPDLQKAWTEQQGRFDQKLSAVLKPEQLQSLQTKRKEILDRFEGQLGEKDVSEILGQLGELGQHGDEVASILQEGFAAKADRLKAIQPDLKKEVQGAFGGFEDIDAQVQEQVTGLLGEQAGDVLGQLQEHERATLGIRLLGR